MIVFCMYVMGLGAEKGCTKLVSPCSYLREGMRLAKVMFILEAQRCALCIWDLPANVTLEQDARSTALAQEIYLALTLVVFENGAEQQQT